MDVEARIGVLAGGDRDRLARLRRSATTPPWSAWELLTAHGMVDGRRLDTPNVHALYLHLSDRLVHRITAGRFDRVVFLDKSARPVAWLVLALWDQLGVAFGDDGQVIERFARPDVTFLNIDRLQWRDVLDPQGVGSFSFEHLPGEVAAGLRRCFLADPADRDVDTPMLWSCPTLLDGQRVLVVDEVQVSGDTAQMAAEFVRRAFPESTVEAGHWMHPGLVTGADGNRRNRLLPVWYRADTALGRGVGDRDPAQSLVSPCWRVRAGAWFLSRPHAPGVIDAAARQLRSEIHGLAAGLLAGEQVLVPDFDRDDAEARSMWFNHMDLRDLVDWRERNRYVITL